MGFISLKALELKEKRQRLLDLMQQQDLDAILLTRQSNFAWYTGGGAGYVALPGEQSSGYLLITPDKEVLIADRIELPRLRDEEVAAAGFDLVTCEWYDDRLAVALNQAAGLRVGADTFVPNAAKATSVTNVAHLIAEQRYSMTAGEVQRYEWVGEQCGIAIGEACRAIKPGMTEFEIAGELSRQVYDRGVTPILALIATDDRIFKYRHPIPTDKKLDKYAMLVLCGRKYGLVASVTRLVHFGAIDADLQKKMNACARIDATFIHATRPGARVADVFDQGVQAYAAQGYPNEWKLHHQGGAAGYEPRDYLASPKSTETVQDWQAFAWNPSITGCKSEDTIIVSSDDRTDAYPRYKIITPTPDWPTIDITIAGETIQRPAILVR